MGDKYIRKTFTFDGKRYTARGKTEVEAIRKMVEMQNSLETGRVIYSSSMLFSTWAFQCVNTYKTNAGNKTISDFKSVLKKICDEIGSMQLKNIKQVHCQQVLNLDKGKSKSTISKTYQALQFVFKKAQEEGLINNDPSKNLIKPKGYTNKRRPLTTHEQKVFTEVATSDRRYYGFLLMLYCGCRPSEAYECKGLDINIIENTPMLHIRGTKTANADRYVPIPNKIYIIIKNTAKFEYICCTANGNGITKNYMKTVWNSFKRQINIAMGCKLYRNQLQPPYPLADDIVQYCLRHTYCTNLAKNGIDIRVAQKLMGHSDISITANIYTHITNNDLSKTYNDINKMCQCV